MSAAGRRMWHWESLAGCLLVSLVGSDRDEDVVADGRIDYAVQSKVGDAAIAWIPLLGADVIAEYRAERVDGGFPEVRPSATRSDGEGELEDDAAVWQRWTCGDLVRI